MNLFDIRNLQYDALIILDGKLPTKETILKLKSGEILAADGAAIQLLKMGIEPDAVVGDLDSLKNQGYDKKIAKDKIVYLPDQNSNDFEKVINYAIEQKFNNLLIIGIHGGELEHTLNNWSVFIKYSQKLNLYIFDENRFGIAVFDSIKLQVDKNEIISLIPQPEVKLTTNGLRWELNKQVLKLGTKEGARNQAIKDIIKIQIHSGSTLLFCDFRFK